VRDCISRVTVQTMGSGSEGKGATGLVYCYDCAE
jgi:hypothetical protein